MKTTIFAILFVCSNAFAADWISFEVQTSGNSISSCGKDKSPSDYMKSYDEMAIPYKILDEAKDKSGAIASLKIFKSAGTSMETTMYFYKSSKSCEAEYKRLFDAKNKAIDEQNKKDGKKYEEYK